jgi:hypothetical protein
MCARRFVSFDLRQESVRPTDEAYRREISLVGLWPSWDQLAPPPRHICGYSQTDKRYRDIQRPCLIDKVLATLTDIIGLIGSRPRLSRLRKVGFLEFVLATIREITAYPTRLLIASHSQALFIASSPRLRAALGKHSDIR